MTKRKRLNAHEILKKASDLIHERGEQRDRPQGERSMGRAVQAFWALYGDDILNGGLLEERHGWAFMECLKHARGWTDDDMLDGIAYAALKAERVMADEADFDDLMARVEATEKGKSPLKASTATLDWWENNRWHDWPTDFPSVKFEKG